jgi:hypothetical protein
MACQQISLDLLEVGKTGVIVVSGFELVWALYESLAQRYPESMARQQTPLDFLVGETEVSIFVLFATKSRCAVRGFVLVVMRRA